MTASVPLTPARFQAGFRLNDDTVLNSALANPQFSTQYGIIAKASGVQSNATQLLTTICRVDTVATAADAVKLIVAIPGSFQVLINNGASAMQVFGHGTDTINGVATATGISQAAGSVALYFCTQAGKWSADIAENANFGAITVSTINGLTITTSTGTLTIPNSVTLTGPATSGTVALINPPPQAGGSTLAVLAAMSGKPILLDTAGGTTATLPAATGSGNKYKFIVSVSTTSNAHKILAASSSDFIIGNAYGYTGSTAKVFGSPAATNHSIQMPFAGSQPSGGIIGDIFDFVDIGTNLWHCIGFYQAGTTPTTPFSSATT